MNSVNTGSRKLVAFLVLGTIVGLALAAIVLRDGGDGNELSGPQPSTSGPAPRTDPVAEQRPVEVAGQPLAPYPGNGEDDGAVGRPAPALRGADFAGSPVAVEANGVPKVVVFLAHWCPHCQEELPRIVEYFDEEGIPDGVEVIAVATGTSKDRPNYPPSAWIRRERFEAPVLADSERSAAGQAYGLTGFPFFVVLDGGLDVVERRSGEVDRAGFEALVERARNAGTG